MKRKTIFIFTLILIMCTRGITYANHGNPEVHFLYAGQSDCILIKTFSKNYLIDTVQIYYTKKFYGISISTI
ncbi:hypothetical protein ACSVC9_01180 [Clostridium sp. LBM24168]